MAGVETGAALGQTTRHALNGVLFMGGLELSYNVYGGTNSSPQTTEVFGGGKRSATLMKWVSIAGAKCLIYAVLGSVIARSIYPALGVILSGASMHLLYLHADSSARKRIAAGGGEEPKLDDSGRSSSSSSWRVAG